MPRRKWALTQAERRAYLALGEELNAAGAMLDLSGFRNEHTSCIRVRQTGEAYAMTVGYGSVYAVEMSIVAPGAEGHS
jgi:hypothetical protein